MPSRVPAGEMRHTVTIKQHKIERGTTAYDSFGQVSQSSTAWETVAKLRAKIEHLSGNEAIIARQIYPNASHRLTVDYNAILASTGGSRKAAVFGLRFLHVGAVIDPMNERFQLQLLCGEER